ncbi:MAG: hypothetical protein WCW84_06725 [Sulfurimonas sp.]|jgi:hypothetical protein
MNQLFDQIKSAEAIIALTQKTLADNPQDEVLQLALKQKDGELVKLCAQLGYEETKPIEHLPPSIKDMRSRWSKNYTYCPIVFAPVGRESVFCFGYVLVDDVLKEISVAHVNNNIFKKQGIKIDFAEFDFEWVFGIFKERLTKHPNVAYHLKGDHHYGKNSIGSSLYIDHARPSCDGLNLGGRLAEYIVRPATECAKKRLIRDSMINLSGDDIITYQIKMGDDNE